MEYVKADPIVDPSKIKEHNDKYLESLQSGFGSGVGPPTPMAMPPIPMDNLVSTLVFCYQNCSSDRGKLLQFQAEG